MGTSAPSPSNRGRTQGVDFRSRVSLNDFAKSVEPGDASKARQRRSSVSASGAIGQVRLICAPECCHGIRSVSSGQSK